MIRRRLLLPLLLFFTTAQAPLLVAEPAPDPTRLLRGDLDIDEAVCDYGLQNGQFLDPADCVRFMQEKRLELARRFNTLAFQNQYQVTYREWVYYRPDSIDLCTYGGCTPLVQGTTLDSAALDQARRHAANGEIRPYDDSSATAEQMRQLLMQQQQTVHSTGGYSSSSRSYNDDDRTYRWGNDDRRRRSYDTPSVSRPSSPPPTRSAPTERPIPEPVHRVSPPPPPPPPPPRPSEPAKPSKPPEEDKPPLNVTRQPIRR